MKRYVLYIFLCLTFSYFYAQESSIDQELPTVNKIYEQKAFQKLLDSSNYLYNNGEYTKSLKLNIKILNKAYDLEDPYYIHQGYRYLAYDYLILNDTILAMESFKKSENYAKLSKNDTATAVTYMDLGNVHATYQEYKKAQIYFKRSINLFKKINDSLGISKAYYNMVVAYMDEEDFDNAYKYILKAKKINKYGNDITFTINLDNFLGEYYLNKNQFQKADVQFQKAIKAAKKDSLNVELENSYFFYSESLFKQKRYKEAFENFKIYDEYSDVNSGVYNSEEKYSLTQKFLLDEYRKDIKAAKLNNELQGVIVKNKTMVNTILIIVSACFLLLLIALYSTSTKRIKLVKELRIKNKEALKAKEESEKLSNAKVKFFSTVSHELRTPLYGVIGLSSILLEDKTLKKHKKDLKFLKFSADYLLALINDVLQINKLDSETIVEEHNSINLRELIETITSSFEYMRIQNDNKIHIDISENIPELISGNSVHLSQVLMNLISNACKFTENGDVYIRAETINDGETNSEIRFTIKDTGLGIPEKMKQSIFEEFSQVNTLNYDNQGSGLGLPIVKKLLAQLNSDIELESELGKGSTFTFTLTFGVIEKAKHENLPKKLDSDLLIGKRILIVEDNRINQIVTQKILEKNEIICSIAENGEEAVNMTRTNSFDLILMDINMPIKNGIEAANEIREFNKSIPIIALTAVEVEEMKNNIYQSGMNDIVVKPYDITKFISCIIKNISENINSHIKAI